MSKKLWKSKALTPIAGVMAILLVALLLAVVPTKGYATETGSAVATEAAGGVGSGEASSSSATSSPDASSAECAGAMPPATDAALTAQDTQLGAQAIPGANVTSEVQMSNGETKQGSFAIGDNGVVMTVRGTAQQRVTATIENGTITNEASNDKTGGTSAQGSAFVATNQSTLVFDSVNIISGLNTLVLNIWHNGGAVQANNLTLTGSANNDNATPFILIGQYGKSGGGTLNFTGDSSIYGARGSIVGGSNSSTINVQGGTLTIKDSDVRVKNGIKLNVHDGATLAIDNSLLALDDGSQIVVKSGGTLVLDGSTYAQTTPSIVLEQGATLRLQNGASFTTSPNAGAFELPANATVEVLSGSTFNLNVDKGMNIASGGTLKVDGGTLNINGTSNASSTKGVKSAGTVELVGATVTSNTPNTAALVNKAGGTLSITSSSLKDVWIDNAATATIDGTADAPSDLKSCVVKTQAGTTLDISHAKLHDSTRNSQETMIHTAGDNANVTIADSEIYNNVNTMPAGNPGASIIKVQNGNLVMSNVYVHDNRCETRGGALYVKGGTLAIDNDAQGSRFERNSAQFLGGAIYLEDVEALIGAATFQNNGYQSDAQMTHQGGAICATRCQIGLVGTTFNNNHARGRGREGGELDGVGGAIYVYGKDASSQVRDTYIDLVGVRFSGNVAERRGGALAVGANAHATIGDNSGDPTEFKGNSVTAGTDYAGGALFIDNAYVDMNDAAIYNNSAPDAGGGMSTCPTGTAQVWSLDGAAIFDNTVSDAASQLADPDIATYRDLYVLTKNHRDSVTGELVAGRDGFPVDWEFELVERMFTGSLHRWAVKNLNSTVGGHTYHSLIAQSDPTGRDVSGAKVVFTDNSVQKSPDANRVVSGGAIACNGLLKIGTTTEIKVVKVWEDGGNADGIRPEMEQFAHDIIVRANGEALDEAAMGALKIRVMNLADHPYVLSDNVIDYEGEALDYTGKDAYIAIISGLPVTDAAGREIVYTIDEHRVEGYTVQIPDEERSVHFGQNTFFELVNTHEPTGREYAHVTLEATKTLRGRELAAGEFSFELRDAAGELVETATCDRDGVVVFDTLHFTESGSYDYTITELAGDDASVTFDASVHGVRVVVTEEGRALHAEVSYTRDGVEVADITFLNEVETTQSFEPVSVGLEATKTLEGRVLSAGEFTFHLYGATGELAQTKANDANGIVLFDTLTFDEPGTYAYQIREDEGNPQITYDDAYHVVTFHVHDAGGGKLEVTKTVELDGKEVDSPSFHNVVPGAPTYESVSLRLEATKTLEGRVLEAGEFSFRLDDADGMTIQTATNDANGIVLFDAVNFDEEGIYTYRVREAVGDDAKVAYDEKVHVVTVTVRADAQGQLEAATHITVDGEEVDALSFDNGCANDKAYVPIEVPLKARKALAGRALAAGEFTFRLDGGEGETIKTATNGADGSVAFGSVSIDRPGTYAYTIDEVVGEAAGVTYDERAYVATVRVREAADGTLVADPTVYTLLGERVEQALFENTYGNGMPANKGGSPASSIPKTGDAALPVGLMALSGLLALAVGTSARRRAGRTRR